MQNFEKRNAEIRQAYLKARKAEPQRFKEKLNLSWSNWGFGIEPLKVSAKRLAKFGVPWIELHGNHYGDDLGYRAGETQKILADAGVKVAGICGMFSTDNDLSSNVGSVRQRAVDYICRELDFGREVGAGYMLIVPGAVGRAAKIDDQEFFRSTETLRLVADTFVESGIRAAIEPIRSAEVSFCHSIADALAYIKAVGHPGVQCVNGDVYHMLVEESHIAGALLEAGARLTNLHLADTNRAALGDGMLDLDTIIMALYLIGYNRPGCYCTPEPLGPGGDPYPAMFGKPDPKKLDDLVRKTAETFFEREEAVRGMK